MAWASSSVGSLSKKRHPSTTPSWLNETTSWNLSAIRLVIEKETTRKKADEVLADRAMAADKGGAYLLRLRQSRA